MSKATRYFTQEMNSLKTHKAMTTMYTTEPQGTIKTREMPTFDENGNVMSTSLIINPLWDTTYRRDYCNKNGFGVSVTQLTYNFEEFGDGVKTRSLTDAPSKNEAWESTYHRDFCSRHLHCNCKGKH